LSQQCKLYALKSASPSIVNFALILLSSLYSMELSKVPHSKSCLKKLDELS